MAAAAGIPFRTYQDIERGETWPQRRNLDAIAGALGVDPIVLFQDDSSRLAPTDDEILEQLALRLEKRIRVESAKAPDLAPAARAIVDILPALDEIQLDALLGLAQSLVGTRKAHEVAPHVHNKTKKRG